MLTLFANPLTMVVGALLISSPIIIHLINRMRFKKVRWAAMEFLLKSQKRSRRKLIIEQMILLFLRILMILLVGLLLARFVGCEKGTEAQQTTHYILLDDTLSTSDSVRGDDGQVRDAFAEERRLAVDKIVAAVAQASSPQFVQVVRLSELDQPRNFGRINPATLDDMRSYLGQFKPSLMHVDLSTGLQAVKVQFEAEKNMRKVLHVVGDVRAIDWGDRNKESLSKSFDDLKTAGVEIHLLDAVAPERSAQQKTPLANDNLAIVDLTPDAKIVAKFQPTEFGVRVRNNSNSEKKSVNIHVRVNGVERAEGLVNIPSLPPNSDTYAKFVLTFDRSAGDAADEIATLDRFNLVSAHLDNEPAGLVADNSRYTVVEVRDRVPILIVDNNPKDRGTKEAESFFLQKLFTEPIKGYDVQVKGVAELDVLNLQPYVSIFICDVPRLSPAALKNIEDYARSGGGVAFFMGPSIKSDVIAEYNEKLYRKGEGVFPVPLDKLVGVDNIDEVKRAADKMRRSFILNKKLLVRRAMQGHPALEKLYKDNRGQAVSEDEYEKFFNFVIIDRYAKVNTQAVQGGAGGAETLIYLQNTNPMDNYTGRVNAMTDKLPVTDPKYGALLARYRQALRQTAGSSGELYLLAGLLDELLSDPGDEQSKRPSMKTFWAAADNTLLREEVEKLRDEVKYGDPLYVAKAFGKGRVVAFMSSAGASWNDLEGFGRAYYPPLMINMQGYLASAGTDANLVLGGAHEFSLDKLAYDSKVKRYFLSADEKANKAVVRPLGEQVMATDDKAAAYTLSFTDGKEPGVYLFRFGERRGEAGKPADGPIRPDFRALPYNVDALAESHLARANTDDVTQISRSPLHTATDEKYTVDLMARPRDLSESPWLYLVILLVLIAEQAMAVRLSFHTRPADAAPAAGPAL